MATLQNKVLGLYISFFNRSADQEELQFWMNQAKEIDADSLLKQLSLEFSANENFSNFYDKMSNQEYVEAIYKNSLGQSGDAQGIEYWTTLLNDGASRSEILVGFVEAALDFDRSDSRYKALSSDELNIAQERQNLLLNKVEVSNQYINKLGDLTQANNTILSDVTDKFASVERAKSKLVILGDRLSQQDIDDIINDYTDRLIADKLEIEHRDGYTWMENLINTKITDSDNNNTPDNEEDNTFIGTANDDTLVGFAGDDILSGEAGDDTLLGGFGNDILRGGAGVDTMDGGDGIDTFIVVGDVSAGGKSSLVYTEADLLNLGFDVSPLNIQNFVGDESLLGFDIATLNGTDYNEDEDGAVEVIRGGDGQDILFVIGTADISNYDMSDVEFIAIRSDVTFSARQLQNIPNIVGDGNSIIRIVTAVGDTVTLDLTQTHFSGMGQVDVGAGVTLGLSALSDLGGANILSGAGTLVGNSGANITLPNTYTVVGNLGVQNSDGTDASGQAQMLDSIVVGVVGEEIIGTDGNDYLVGTDEDDVFDGRGGNDILSGKEGSDTYKITSTGNKVIVDSGRHDSDTIDLSQLTGNVNANANVSLVNGGTYTVDGTSYDIDLGTEGTIGAAASQYAPENNLTFIIDVSGSMSTNTANGSTRMEDAKDAAIELIDAYQNIGDVAVRLVAFETTATSTFAGVDTWLDAENAKTIIETLVAGGGTGYYNAIEEAKTAIITGDEVNYFQNGLDSSYFLSDGIPGDGGLNGAMQTAWEDFLVDNQITSQAIGFGGIGNTSYLEPIAYDGVNDVELEAILESDTANLGELLVSTATLDFIENLIGTSGDDIITGNSLVNTLTGGLGADTFVFETISGEVDTITDFEHGVDTLKFIDLEGLEGFDTTVPGFLVDSTQGLIPAHPVFIFNDVTKVLSYSNVDGLDFTDPIDIVTLTGVTDLSMSDISLEYIV